MESSAVEDSEIGKIAEDGATKFRECRYIDIKKVELSDFGNKLCYPFDSDYENTVYVFNQKDYGDIDKNRTGTEKDVEKIEACFQNSFDNCKYKVKTEHDLDADEILTKLDEIAKENVKRNILIIIFLCHGKSDGELLAKDNTPLDVEKIWRKFTPTNCKLLMGKPKWFIFQACKGSEWSIAVKGTTDGDLTKPPEENLMVNHPYEITLPEEADILLSYSTIEGQASFRVAEAGTGNIETGAIYISQLCENIQKYAKVEDIFSILTRVASDVAHKYNIMGNYQQYKQISSFCSTMTKKCFLDGSKSTNKNAGDTAINEYYDEFLIWAGVNMSKMSKEKLEIARAHIELVIKHK